MSSKAQIGTSILFARESDNRFDVDDEGNIALTKSGVAVPLNSELIIDFYIFYGGESYKGEVRFCATTVGEVTEYVMVGPDNMVMFTINWVVDSESLISFYDVESDNSTSSSTSSGEEYDFLDMKETGLSSVEPCGLLTSGKMKVEGLSPQIQPPAVTQTDRNELCSMAKVRLQFGNLYTFEVDERVALMLHYREYKDHGDCYTLPNMTRKVATHIIDYCQAAVAGKSFLTNDTLDDLTIFSLILASHSLKVRCLLKQTCDTFIARAEIKFWDLQFLQIILGNVDDEEELEYADVSRVLRRGESGRLTLISKCVVPKRQRRFISDQEMPFIKRRVDSFIDDACKFMTFENIDQKAQYIQVLETSTRREPRLAELVEAADPTTFMAFVSRLIIHDLRDPHFDIKIGAMSILSRMAVDKSRDMIRDEAVPHIVELLSHEHVPLQMAAVMALTCLLSSSSANVSMVSKMDALRAAPAIIRCPGHGVEIIDNMRKMVEALIEVDKIYSKENHLVLLEVVRSFFRKDLGYYNLHRVSACRGLCYQSYRRPFLIDRDVCSLLIDFIRNENSPTELVGAALEVVGNIVMWGKGKLIKILTEDCGLLRCLETHVLLCDKDIFRKEACTIISNIAIHSRRRTARLKLLKEMHEVNLLEKLYELLKNGAPDVKIEAAWACGNAIFGFAPHHMM